MPNFLDACGSTDYSQRSEYPYADFDVPGIVRRATDAIRALFATGKLRPADRPLLPADWLDWGHEITVHFIPHDFWVPVAFTWENGQRVTRPRCCIGMADGNHYEIFISTRIAKDIPFLLRWETVNCWLHRAGRSDWMDRHSPFSAPLDQPIPWLITPDPGYTPPVKRRSVGRR